MATTALSHQDAHEARCECGQLMARLTVSGVELKCKRCKRIQVIPWADVRKGDSK